MVACLYSARFGRNRRCRGKRPRRQALSSRAASRRLKMIGAKVGGRAFSAPIVAALLSALITALTLSEAQADDDSWVGKAIITKKEAIRLRKTEDKDREDYVAALTNCHYEVLEDKGGLVKVRQDDVEGWFDKNDA